MRIANPEALWWLWLVPALAVFLVVSLRHRKRLLERFVSLRLVAGLSSEASSARRALKALLVLLALTAGILALARPQWGFTWEERRRVGVDIVLALDVSRSMQAADAGSESLGQAGLSRLERARREIDDFLERAQGDRIGLVAFAGTAFLECPLTLDHGAARLFLRSFDADLIPVPGTDLATAIRTSVAAFDEGSPATSPGTVDAQSRAVVLITDGEDHSRGALAAAEEAARAGVRIFAIGVGRAEGTPIPLPGGGFHRDRQGEIVLSRLDEETLRRIAQITGGRYTRSVAGDLDLEQIYAQGIRTSLEGRELASRQQRRWHPRFRWALGVAILALMVETWIPERRFSPPHPDRRAPRERHDHG